MGTWICHLRIVEQLLVSLPDLDAAAFCFGNLAPDSGIPNADWTAFDPPKEVTHFLKSGEGEGRIRDLAFYREYMLPLSDEPSGERWSFLLGYFCHLLCDNLWSRRIGKATKVTYAAQFERDPLAVWNMVKKDWYDLDHRYVRDHPESVFWRVVLLAPNPPMYVPLVPTHALHHQLDYIRTFYSQPDSSRRLDRPYPYLNEQTMNRFVLETSADILMILNQVMTRSQTDSGETSLLWLDTNRLVPFMLPLGDVSSEQAKK